MTLDPDDLERHFEGRAVLEKLLTDTGSLADAEDVVNAFGAALKDSVPVAVVIQALWEDEPRFESPKKARQLFSNLFGLFDLVEAGATIDLATAGTPTKRARAPKPAPFSSSEGPDDAFVEGAWRYFADAPKERQRLEHVFDNKQDALVSWLDTQGLTDDAFGLARQLVCDVYAMLELGGHSCPLVHERAIPEQALLPAALTQWLDEGVFEAEQSDEAPLPEAAGQAVRALTARAASALWKPAKQP
jgi:hypothetical protein